jgi:hypothetical protein
MTDPAAPISARRRHYDSPSRPTASSASRACCYSAAADSEWCRRFIGRAFLAPQEIDVQYMRMFSAVTTAILSRMQALGRSEYGIVYDCPEGAAGIATSQTPICECVIEFVYDREQAELALVRLRKPPLLPEDL